MSINARSRVPILDLVDHQAAVATRSEQPIVVMAEAHSLDWPSMSLHFLDELDGELPDLHSTGASCFTGTCEKCLTSGHHLNLSDVILGSMTSIWIVQGRVICSIIDLALIACNDCPSNIVWDVHAAFHLLVSYLKVVLFAPRLLKLLLLQVIKADLSLIAAIREA